MWRCSAASALRFCCLSARRSQELVQCSQRLSSIAKCTRLGAILGASLRGNDWSASGRAQLPSPCARQQGAAAAAACLQAQPAPVAPVSPLFAAREEIVS